MQYDLFIIESLSRENENEGRYYEGKFIKDYLDLVNGDRSRTEYVYIRTKRELEKLAVEFEKEGYDNLFVSCHGNKNYLHLTYDDVTYAGFSEIFSNGLNWKRVFVSACGTGNKAFSEALFKANDDIKSFISPTEDVYFKSTFAFWPAFFYLLSWLPEVNAKRLRQALRICVNIFCVPMLYFGTTARTWTSEIFQPELEENRRSHFEDAAKAMRSIQACVLEAMKEDE